MQLQERRPEFLSATRRSTFLTPDVATVPWNRPKVAGYSSAGGDAGLIGNAVAQ
jgi:hypothetical protein